MSKNMMMDGSVRIFAVKMSNDDIQKAADRIRGAAETILKTLTQERVDEVKKKTGRDKGVALNEVITNVTDTINRIYATEHDICAKVILFFRHWSFSPLPAKPPGAVRRVRRKAAILPRR